MVGLNKIFLEAVKKLVEVAFVEYVVVGPQMVMHGPFSESRDPVVADT